MLNILNLTANDSSINTSQDNYTKIHYISLKNLHLRLLGVHTTPQTYMHHMEKGHNCQVTDDERCPLLPHEKAVVFRKLCGAVSRGSSTTTRKDWHLSDSAVAQLSFDVSVQLLTWMSFLSCRDTQLSQLRLVVISPTISHVSVSSQYLSIVSWYLKQMAKYRTIISGCPTLYPSVITAVVKLQKMTATKTLFYKSNVRVDQ